MTVNDDPELTSISHGSVSSSMVMKIFFLGRCLMLEMLTGQEQQVVVLQSAGLTAPFRTFLSAPAEVTCPALVLLMVVAATCACPLMRSSLFTIRVQLTSMSSPSESLADS
ncbi:UNVERIFIED_CONTAM: hypothetical protein K2H54_057728 [Gekko kuhli]